MYLRTTRRRNKDGSTVSYLQLAHNEWDAAAGVSRRRVLYNFGRADQVDQAAVRRLIASLSQAVGAGPALAAAGPAGLAFTESRPLGGTHVLDGLWRRLGIDATIRRLVADPRAAERTERVLFALVANRALKPSSKLAAASWISQDVAIAGLAAVDEDACYRAMDRLLAIEDQLAEQVYWAVADLLNLEVDLLFFDTTSTYFQTEQHDEPIARDHRGRPLSADPAPGTEVTEGGFRAHGHSKDHREDLPQVVIGMAVTRAGIPIRVWTWPGNTTDAALIRQVKADLREWKLGRVVRVADRGFASEANRRYLQRAGGHYILGEKLRSGSPEVTAALTRGGRYQTITANLRIKEVRLPDTGDRFVVCHNPDHATRDQTIREDHITQLEQAIAGTDTLPLHKRTELAGQLRTKPAYARYLRVTTSGLLRLDLPAIARETNLDGKFLLRCSDPHLSAEDIALGYKQLLDVERGWRDMKHIIDLRPVYHRREDRIRAHILLCWLALLLIRITETTCGHTWPHIRAHLDRLHLGTFTGPAGTYRQRTELTPTQRHILTALDIPTPPRVIEATPTP
jgi:hypothetical protein